MPYVAQQQRAAGSGTGCARDKGAGALHALHVRRREERHPLARPPPLPEAARSRKGATRCFCRYNLPRGRVPKHVMVSLRASVVRTPRSGLPTSRPPPQLLGARPSPAACSAAWLRRSLGVAWSTMPAAKQAAASRWGWLRLVLCAAGIYGAYLTQGMVQEDLSTRRCAAVAPPRRRPGAHPARPPQIWGGEGAVHARRVPEPGAERGVHVLVRPLAARAARAGRQRARTALLAGRAEQHGGARVRGAGAQKHQARGQRASPSAPFSRRFALLCAATRRRCLPSRASSSP